MAFIVISKGSMGGEVELCHRLESLHGAMASEAEGVKPQRGLQEVGSTSMKHL